MNQKNTKFRKFLAVVLSIVVATGVFTGTFATALDNNLSQQGDQQVATTVQDGQQSNSEQNSVDIPEIEISGNTSEWTKTKTIVVTVKNPAQGVSYEYSNGGTEWGSENSFVITENNDYVFYARVAGNDEKKASKSVKVEKIDNKDPSNMTVTKIPDNWTKANSEISVKVTAEDDTAILYSMDKNSWQSEETFKFSPEEKSYTFYAKDESGNISEKILSSKELKVDGTNPTINEVYLTYNDIKTGSYISEKETFKLVIDSTDGEGSGCVEYSFYDSNDTENSISKSGENYFVIKYSDIPESGKFIIKVKDLVGNESTKEFSVKKDTTAPYNLTATGGNTEYTNKAITYTLSATDDDSDNIVYYLDGNKVENNTITIEDDAKHTVYAVDLVGNKSEPITVQAENYFKGEISVTATVEKKDAWETEKTVTVTGTPIKNKSGKECPVISYAMDDNTKWQTSNQFKLTDTKKHTFYVKDKAGNEGSAQFSSKYIDTTAPTFKSAKITTENDNKIAEVLNYLTFGYFFNKTYSIQIEANDENSETKLAQSGIEKYIIEFYKGTEENEDNLVYCDSNETGEFSLEKDVLENFKGIIKVTIIDNAGNKTKDYLTSENCKSGDENSENIENIIKEFIIENDAPEISDEVYLASANSEFNKGFKIVEEEEKTVYFGQPIQFTFNVNDLKENKVNSGIGGVKFSAIDGPSVTFDYSSNKVDKKEYTVTAKLNENKVMLSFYDGNETKEISFEPDDNLRFKLEVSAQDNAGNESKKELGTYQIDTDTPELEFQFGDSEENKANGEKLNNSVEIKEYGFFFKEDVEVTITASDDVSGVKSVSVYLLDCDGTRYIPSDDGKSLVKLDEENADDAKVYEIDEVSFAIPANFKGQVYAKAIDKVDNDTGFLHPNGTVVESQEKHNETSSITIEPTEKTKYTQAGSDTPLYNKDVEFEVKVSDTYSGIKEITYEIENGKETDKVDWTETKEENTNLVVEKSKTIKINGNSNDIKLTVTLTDNAGNTSVKTYEFGIDKTQPKVFVTYDNNNADSDNYFKKARTATIKVEERNFDKDRVVLKVEKDGKTYLTKVKWNEISSGTKENNYDDKVNQAVINYNQDGDYKFSLSVDDTADNANTTIDFGNSVAPKKFTIDTVKPKVSVTYDNNNVQNEKYFNAQRTVTVVVEEHNFDSSRTIIKHTASLNGTSVNLPKISWVKNKDINTAIITYSADGDYTFDITVLDKAGNIATPSYNGVATKEFTVDKTIDSPTITSPKDGTAYNGEFTIKAGASDVNLADCNVKLMRKYKDIDAQDVTGLLNISQNEQNLDINGIIPEEKENDGIYTLEISITDKAGNSSNSSSKFTVNRFGSVYEYNDELISLIRSGYVSKVNNDLIITEYNASKLENDSLNITVTCDGKPLDNVVYTANPKVLNKANIGESGWYRYEYTISKSNFEKEGIYKISVSSKDNAGNTPENSTKNSFDENGKKVIDELLFTVDKTAPEITNISNLETNIINATQVEVKYSVFDTVGLKSIEVFINGNKEITVTDFKDDINNYSDKFILEESSSVQTVRLLITDLAGNITDTSSDNFKSEFEFNDEVTVSTNLFVRWYANTTMFWISIAAMVTFIFGSGAVTVLRFRKRKK